MKIFQVLLLGALLFLASAQEAKTTQDEDAVATQENELQEQTEQANLEQNEEAMVGTENDAENDEDDNEQDDESEKAIEGEESRRRRRWRYRTLYGRKRVCRRGTCRVYRVRIGYERCRGRGRRLRCFKKWLHRRRRITRCTRSGSFCVRHTWSRHCKSYRRGRRVRKYCKNTYRKHHRTRRRVCRRRYCGRRCRGYRRGARCWKVYCRRCGWRYTWKLKAKRGVAEGEQQEDANLEDAVQEETNAEQEEDQVQAENQVQAQESDAEQNDDDNEDSEKAVEGEESRRRRRRRRGWRYRTLYGRKRVCRRGKCRIYRVRIGYQRCRGRGRRLQCFTKWLHRRRRITRCRRNGTCVRHTWSKHCKRWRRGRRTRTRCKNTYRRHHRVRVRVCRRRYCGRRCRRYFRGARCWKVYCRRCGYRFKWKLTARRGLEGAEEGVEEENDEDAKPENAVQEEETNEDENEDEEQAEENEDENEEQAENEENEEDADDAEEENAEDEEAENEDEDDAEDAEEEANEAEEQEEE